MRIRNVRRYASPECSTAIVLMCFEKMNIAKLKTDRAGSPLPAPLRITISGAHGVTRPTWRTLLAVATEDVRLYTLFLPLEP